MLAQLLTAVGIVLAVLFYLYRMEKRIMASLADIQADVTAEKTVVDSAVALLAGLSQQLKDALAANDPKTIQAIIDGIDANKAALAVAVTANTPPPAPAV